VFDFVINREELSRRVVVRCDSNVCMPYSFGASMDVRLQGDAQWIFEYLLVLKRRKGDYFGAIIPL